MHKINTDQKLKLSCSVLTAAGVATCTWSLNDTTVNLSTRALTASTVQVSSNGSLSSTVHLV